MIDLDWPFDMAYWFAVASVILSVIGCALSIHDSLKDRDTE